MQDQTNNIAEAGLLALVLSKFLPPAIGAGIMVAVDPPKTKRDLFARAFVAFAASWLFGETLFDFLDNNVAIFAFLDHAKKSHVTAIDGALGAVGWFIAGGVAVLLKRFRTKPMKTIDDLIERVNKVKGSQNDNP